MYTEAQAWRTIGEAFEALHEEPDIRSIDGTRDLAAFGLCHATGILVARGDITEDMETAMDELSKAAVTDSLVETGEASAYMLPRPYNPGGAEIRATLAYLHAEEAASAVN